MEEKGMVIFKDEHMLVMDKPPAMVTTNEGRDEKNSLENWLRKEYPNELARNGIMHRLDKGTSGLVVAARTEAAFEALKKQFKQRTVKKKYLALIGGDLPFEGNVNMPIGRSPYGFGKFGVRVDGKAAITEFRVKCKYKKDGRVYSLVEVDLKTGRTHQIRVHFSYLKWPLVGDKLYGGEMPEGLGRQFLHACELRLTHPESKKELVFLSELPEDLQLFLKAYEKLA